MGAIIQGLSGWQLGLKHHCKRKGYCQVPALAILGYVTFIHSERLPESFLQKELGHSLF